MPSRTVEVAAADLPGYIAGLPRLLTEDLLLNVSGTMAGVLSISGLYGPGSLNINGFPTMGATGVFEVQGNVTITNCHIELSINGMTVHQIAPHPENASPYMILIQGCGPITFQKLTLIGLDNKKVGLSTYGTPYIEIVGMEASNCATVVIIGSGIIGISGADEHYSGNTVGVHVWRSGIVVLSPSTPDTLGGTTNLITDAGCIIQNGAFVV